MSGSTENLASPPVPAWLRALGIAAVAAIAAAAIYAVAIGISNMPRIGV
jgi:hypothetical protein